MYFSGKKAQSEERNNKKLPRDKTPVDQRTVRTADIFIQAGQKRFCSTETLLRDEEGKHPVFTPADYKRRSRKASTHRRGAVFQIPKSQSLL